MRTLDELSAAVQREALRAEFPIDRPVYERSEQDPTRPVLCAGTLDAHVCVMGRDLGKDEVAAGEPLIGAGGRLVRAGVYEAFEGAPPPPRSDRRIAEALRHVLLTNTVPYKPPGNKAYASAVKERFRPFIVELLATLWKGERIITLGTEAFQWFAPYGDPDAFATFWGREERYENDIACVLTAETPEGTVRKPVTISPLPHPSPLNQRWYKRFPELLARRLAQS